MPAIVIKGEEDMTRFQRPGNTAVITGGAGGIGFAAAKRFVAEGMDVLISDINANALQQAVAELQSMGGGKSYSHVCDVSDPNAVEQLRDYAFENLGKVNCLMNNAGIVSRAGLPWEGMAQLNTTLKINLMGIIHGCHAFVPAMLNSGERGVVVNTGSKQGITRPPGSYEYNLSKAGVMAYTESVAYALREVEGGKLSAHLLVPGFVYSPMISRFLPEKPASAWTPEETISFAMPCIERGDFYVICPDNETPHEMDVKRILWNADDIVKNRPALSRWHADFKEEFEAYMKG